MTTTIAICELSSCHYNLNRRCTLPFITLDHKGTCDQQTTQEPLPEPTK